MDDLRTLSAQDIVAALLESDPGAYISEQESGWYVVDGRFDLEAAARKLCGIVASRDST